MTDSVVPCSTDLYSLLLPSNKHESKWLIYRTRAEDCVCWGRGDRVTPVKWFRCRWFCICLRSCEKKKRKKYNSNYRICWARAEISARGHQRQIACVTGTYEYTNDPINTLRPCLRIRWGCSLPVFRNNHRKRTLLYPTVVLHTQMILLVSRLEFGSVKSRMMSDGGQRVELCVWHSFVFTNVIVLTISIVVCKRWNLLSVETTKQDGMALTARGVGTSWAGEVVRHRGPFPWRLRPPRMRHCDLVRTM